MGVGIVALCKTDPAPWAQTLMPHHLVEAVVLRLNKRFPTGKISRQQNQSPNKPVQNANTCRTQNPDTLRAGRVGAAHGGAVRGNGAG